MIDKNNTKLDATNPLFYSVYVFVGVGGLEPPVPFEEQIYSLRGYQLPVTLPLESFKWGRVELNHRLWIFSPALGPTQLLPH